MKREEEGRREGEGGGGEGEREEEGGGGEGERDGGEGN